jgi:geranylgeranyl diphosphate synthase type II
VTGAASLQESLARLKGQVDEALARFVVAADTPPVLAPGLRHPIEAGGKRLRPVLCLASAEAVAPLYRMKEPDAAALALHAACALELIHTYSLVHDDLPAMDDDTLRRGRPTTHVVYGDGFAVLVGDALLTRAFEVLVSQPDRDGSLAWRKLQVIGLVAKAAGAEGMVGGQAIDLHAAGKGPASMAAPALDAVTLRAMHARKTGALIRAAATCGAIMAGASPGVVGAIDRYAAELGLAFQIVDDILDVEGSAAELGKSAGKDAASGKPTYPALFGLEESRQMAADCVDRAIAALNDAHVRGILPDLAQWILTRRS